MVLGRGGPVGPKLMPMPADGTCARVVQMMYMGGVTTKRGRIYTICKSAKRACVVAIVEKRRRSQSGCGRYSIG